ncbi:hypothetical protein [Blastopirellula marina]|uniref:Uncharacterized protein n=1 Tax=Blastopirellula marina TaxID=124 RepID=A0A2S8GIF5_9BACT|nr:hypothetical protein [Blastopirellula marina]PQO44232.1 hypothetical protein C5Y93_19915 [Blastopirellula marina]
MSHPAAENPDLHILGTGLYSNVCNWQLIVTPERIEIAPTAVPWRSILIYNGIFLLFFGGWGFLVARYGDLGLPVTALAIAAVFYLFTGGLFTGWIVWTFRQALDAGPWLIIDRAERTIQLPREGVTAPLSQVDHLQAISTTRYGSNAWLSQGDILSELNLVMRDGDAQRRYPLLRSIFDGAFDKLAAQIAEFDLVPVKRIRGNSERICETWLTTDPSA